MRGYETENVSFLHAQNVLSHSFSGYFEPYTLFRSWYPNAHLRSFLTWGRKLWKGRTQRRRSLDVLVIRAAECTEGDHQCHRSPIHPQGARSSCPPRCHQHKPAREAQLDSNRQGHQGLTSTPPSVLLYLARQSAKGETPMPRPPPEEKPVAAREANSRISRSQGDQGRSRSCAICEQCMHVNKLCC